MIRYLSCTHDNAERDLTDAERALYKSCQGVIVTDKGVTRFEEVRVVADMKFNSMSVIPKRGRPKKAVL